MAPRLIAFFIASLLIAFGTARAQQPQDPPARVGRLSLIEGSVQQRTADAQDWGAAELNYPVTTGFATAVQEGGRTEIEVGTMAIRVGGGSELDVGILNDKTAIFTVVQGEINLRVRSLGADERIQVVTPRGIIDIVQAGQYHVDAGTTQDPTRVAVLRGDAQLEQTAGPLDVANGQAALITGDGSNSNDVTQAQASTDPLDAWAAARDRPS